MNSTIDILKNHRSIRKFVDRPLEEGMLNEMIFAGQSASTSSFIQSCSVIRVTEPSARNKFVALSGGQKYIESAAEFLVFCADLERNRTRVLTKDVEADFSWAEQGLAATVDVALFAQNVVTAAESMGLGCCYIGGIRNDPDAVVEILNLPALVYPVFGLCIGYPGQDPDIKPRLPTSVVLHQGQYGVNKGSSLEIDTYDAQIKSYYHERTGGKLDIDWSGQMAKQAESQSRPFMLEFLRKQGFFQK